MKTLYNVVLVLILCTTNLLGNAGPPPPPPLFYAKTEGAIYQPPLNLADSGQTALFIQMSTSTVSDIDGRIDLNGTVTDQDGLRDGKNFEWDVPNLYFRFGVAPAFSEYTSMFLLINVANRGGNISLDGLDWGFNNILTRDENHYLRVGIGINIRKKNFVWIRSSDGAYEKDNKFDYDPLIQLTYNTSFDDWVFNPFIQVSYSKQTLMDKEQYRHEVYSNIDVFTITPGISHKWGGNLLISLGSTCNFLSGIENSKNFVLTPFIQMSFLLDTNNK